MLCKRRRLTMRQVESLKNDLDIDFDNNVMRSQTVGAFLTVCDVDEAGDRAAWATLYRQTMNSPPSTSWDRREIILRLVYRSLSGN